jgi:hypothetical protein
LSRNSDLSKEVNAVDETDSKIAAKPSDSATAQLTPLQDKKSKKIPKLTFGDEVDSASLKSMNDSAETSSAKLKRTHRAIMAITVITATLDFPSDTRDSPEFQKERIKGREIKTSCLRMLSGLLVLLLVIVPIIVPNVVLRIIKTPLAHVSYSPHSNDTRIIKVLSRI